MVYSVSKNLDVVYCVSKEELDIVYTGRRSWM